MSHVRFASQPLGPTPSRRRASTGDPGTEIGTFRRSLRSRQEMAQFARSVDLTPQRSALSSSSSSSFLSVPTVQSLQGRLANSSALIRPPSDLDLARLVGPNGYRPQSTPPVSPGSASTAYSPNRRSRSPQLASAGDYAPRPGQLAPPRFLATKSSPSAVGGGGVPSLKNTSIPRPTVGQAKTILFDALESYDCPLEDKLRVLRKLALEVQNELIEVSSMPNPPPRTASASPRFGDTSPMDIGEAVRAVKEANRAKAVAVAQLQKIVNDSKIPPLIRR